MLAQTETAAAAIAKAWQGGADWAAVQKAAQAAGATALALPNITPDQVPNPALAAAAFKAAADSVTGPVPTGGSGYAVFDVTAISPAGPSQTYAQAAPAIRMQLARQQAEGIVNQRVNELQDALAGRTPLERLPGDLGLAALQGSIDSNGLTEQGAPAPIPGSDALRQAIVAQVYKQGLHQPAALINGPDNSYFALTVDGITPATMKPYAAVQQQVLASWTQDQMVREQRPGGDRHAAGDEGWPHASGGRQRPWADRDDHPAADPPGPGARWRAAEPHRAALFPQAGRQHDDRDAGRLRRGQLMAIQTPNAWLPIRSATTSSRPPLRAASRMTCRRSSPGVVTATANPRINQAVIQQIAQP